MPDEKKLEELIAAKVAAGLPRSVATEVAKEQIAHDARLEKAEADQAAEAETKAAKAAKTKKAGGSAE